MKKIIALIAVALAMVIPATMSATDYYGYDNDTKTVLMEWVENAINADYISFDTQEHEDDFLDLINSLYNARDNEDWGDCVAIADGLEIAAQYIDGEEDRELVASLCDCTEAVYTDTEHLMVITPTDQGDIQNALVINGGGTASTDTYHTANCDDIYIGDSFVHSKGCGTLTSVQPQQ